MGNEKVKEIIIKKALLISLFNKNIVKIELELETMSSLDLTNPDYKDTIKAYKNAIVELKAQIDLLCEDLKTSGIAMICIECGNAFEEICEGGNCDPFKL